MVRIKKDGLLSLDLTRFIGYTSRIFFNRTDDLEIAGVQGYSFPMRLESVSGIN